jgi:hypothetical protein
MNILNFAFSAPALKDGRAVARPYGHRSVVGMPNGASAGHLSYMGVIRDHQHFAVHIFLCLRVPMIGLLD